MTKNKEFETMLKAAEHVSSALDYIIGSEASITIYHLATAATSTLAIVIARLPDLGIANGKTVSSLHALATQLQGIERRIEERFGVDVDGWNTDANVFLAIATCHQTAGRLTQAACELDMRLAASGGNEASAAAVANANEHFRGRSSVWMRGFAEGQKGMWSEHLADQESPVGDSYLDGWNVGSKAAKQG